MRALTLVGPTRDNMVLDPLAVLHLDNQLFINVVQINGKLLFALCMQLNGDK